jgi:acetyl-CoA acyltransferase
MIFNPLKSRGSRAPVFVEGLRTPFVKSFGSFAQANTLELFSRVLGSLVTKTGIDPNILSDVICGVVIPQVKNPNVARDAVINLGFPLHIAGYTLGRACTSSLQAVANAADTIRSGKQTVIVAGGVECLSDVPITYSVQAQRFLVQLSRARSVPERLKLLRKFSLRAWLPSPPSLTEPLTGLTMGEHAEIMAKVNMISREDQDKFAVRSHSLASKAQQDGKLAEEIIPVWPQSKPEKPVLADDIIRHDTSVSSIAGLRPAFDKKYGTITAANSSPLTDGASACLITDEKYASELGLTPKARIVDSCFIAVDPNEQLLIGPAIAIPLILRSNDLTIDDIDLFEIHEAFAAQVLSCQKAMKSADFMERHFGDKTPFGEIPDEKLNVNGGAIAIGHPFGATGVRLITSIINELKRRGKRRGIVAICAAGGMAGAMLIEVV